MWLQGAICPAAQYQCCHMGTATRKINNKPLIQREKYNWQLLIFTPKACWFLLSGKDNTARYLMNTNRRRKTPLLTVLGKWGKILEFYLLSCSWLCQRIPWKHGCAGNSGRSLKFNSTENKFIESYLSWQYDFCFMSLTEPHVLVHQIQDTKGDKPFVFPPWLT